MSNYYFLAASLPPLAIDEKPEITFSGFMVSALENLNKEDAAKMALLLRMVDFENARSHLKGFPLDLRGNLSESDLNEALLTQSELPDYFFEFLEGYDSPKEAASHLPALFATYFNLETPTQEGFVKRYLEFERQYRIVLAALRAKEIRRDVLQEMQFEDFSDLLVADVVAQKDTENYEPPMEFHRLKEIFAQTQNDPLERYMQIEQYRFERIEELVETPLFSIDWILAYMLQLMIVERIWELNESRAEAVFQKFTAV